MVYFATKRFSYWGQLGILAAMSGVGLIIGGVASIIPLLGKINILDLKNLSSASLIDDLLKPENAAVLRWSQCISTLFLFFLPPVFYSWICHRKVFMHLGFNQSLDSKKIILVLLIMIACLPVVGALQELTELLPWSKSMLQQFKTAEDSYNREVAVMARMNNFGDYIISLVVIAFLPAVFEETLFRGALQNLLSRWSKMPVISIIVTAIIFSAVHGSYLGFLSRFALGFILGWIFYRTGNIWLNIIAHFFNNAFAITALYSMTAPGHTTDPSKIDDHFPLWIGMIGIVVVIGLFIFFEKLNKKDIDRPGEEVLIPGFNHSDHPFSIDDEMKGETL